MQEQRPNLNNHKNHYRPNKISTVITMRSKVPRNRKFFLCLSYFSRQIQVFMCWGTIPTKQLTYWLKSSCPNSPWENLLKVIHINNRITRRNGFKLTIKTWHYVSCAVFCQLDTRLKLNIDKTVIIRTSRTSYERLMCLFVLPPLLLHYKWCRTRTLSSK